MIGGAICWKNKSPILRNNTYKENSAQIYGENIASFARKLSFIDKQIGEELRAHLTHYDVESPMRTI